MRVTKIKSIPFLNSIPDDHRRWVDLEKKPIEEPSDPPSEEPVDVADFAEDEPILYDRYGRLRKPKKPSRLIKIT